MQMPHAALDCRATRIAMPAAPRRILRGSAQRPRVAGEAQARNAPVAVDDAAVVARNAGVRMPPQHLAGCRLVPDERRDVAGPGARDAIVAEALALHVAALWQRIRRARERRLERRPDVRGGDWDGVKGGRIQRCGVGIAGINDGVEIAIVLLQYDTGVGKNKVIAFFAEDFACLDDVHGWGSVGGV